MDVNSLFGLFLVLLILIIIFLDRKNIKVVKGVIFLRRIRKIRNIVDRIAERHSKFFNVMGTFSIIIPFISLFVFIYFSIHQLLQPPKIAPIQIVLPQLPGICDSSFILCVPPYFWLIIIPIVAASHEIMHAVIARANKLEIKSMGYAFFLFLPAFFVEIDEKDLRKADLLTKLKIYSAGSLGNFIITFLVLILSFFIVKFLERNFGGLIIETLDNTPAYYANLSGILLKIDGKEINSLNDLIEIAKNFKPKQSLLIETTEGLFNVTLTENATIGIRVLGEAYYPKTSFAKEYKDIILSFLLNLREFLFWLYLLNFGVGLFNLLPIIPLDGGLFFRELLYKKMKKTGKILYAILSYFTIFLIFSLILKYILRI